ncbi:MAG: fibronectin type III domain-containing protein, partial [Actinomycetes bacterium]
MKLYLPKQTSMAAYSSNGWTCPGGRGEISCSHPDPLFNGNTTELLFPLIADPDAKPGFGVVGALGKAVDGSAQGANFALVNLTDPSKPDSLINVVPAKQPPAENAGLPAAKRTAASRRTAAVVNPAAPTNLQVLVASGSATVTFDAPETLPIGADHYIVTAIGGFKPVITQSGIVGGYGVDAKVALGLDGKVYFTDPNNNSVVSVDQNGTRQTVASGIFCPSGVAIAPDGVLYVSSDCAGNSSSSGQVIAIATDGTQSVAIDNLYHPTGITIDPFGNVIVADPYNQQVVKLSTTGEISTLGSGYYYPFGVATDAAGNVFVADTYNYRIVKITPEGVQSTYASVGQTVYDLAVDRDGGLLIADTWSNQILRVDANGASSQVVAGITYPTALAVNADGELFIRGYFNDLSERLLDNHQCVTAGLETTCTVTGLTNGVPYSVTVAAVAGASSGPASETIEIVPVGVSDRPLEVRATSGLNLSALVEWMAPGFNGGTAITGYVVTARNLSHENGLGDGNQCTTDSPEILFCSVAGLRNGDQYSFTVVALNAVGSSDPSEPTSAIPSTPPSGPTNVALNSAAAGQLTVTWLASTFDNGGAITSYRVELRNLSSASPGQVVGTCTVKPVENFSCSFTNLLASDLFEATVVATNASGDSVGVATDAESPIGTEPTPPGNVVGSSRDHSVLVTWSPSDFTGALETTYMVIATNLDQVGGPGDGAYCSTNGATSCTVTGLRNGYHYSFVVVAANSFGPSLPSLASSSVIPVVMWTDPSLVGSVAAGQIYWSVMTSMWCADAQNCVAFGFGYDAYGPKMLQRVEADGVWGDLVVLPVPATSLTGAPGAAWCADTQNCHLFFGYWYGGVGSFSIDEINGVWQDAVIAPYQPFGLLESNVVTISCSSFTSCTAVGLGWVPYYGGYRLFTVTLGENNTWETGQTIEVSGYGVGSYPIPRGLNCPSFGNCNFFFENGGRLYEVDEINGVWGESTDLSAYLSTNGNLSFDAVRCTGIGECVILGVRYVGETALHFSLRQHQGVWGGPVDFLPGVSFSVQTLSCSTSGVCTALIQLWSDGLVYATTMDLGSSSVVAPSAPSSVTATVGDGSVTIHITPPAFNGGSPISHYHLVVTDSDQVVLFESDCDSTDCIIQL